MAGVEAYRNSNVNIHVYEDDDSYYDEEQQAAPPRKPTGGRIHPLQGNNPDSSKIAVDFDAFSSDAEKLSAILKCADVEQQ